MEWEPRENQKEAIQKGIDFFSKKRTSPSLMVLPTAWGKSWLISAIAKNYKKSDEKFLVLSPSLELLQQNVQKFRLSGGQPSIYSASAKEKEIGHVTYATLGSIKSLGPTFKQLGIKYLIIDEVHQYSRNTDGMLHKFIVESGITHILGLTASPLKLQTSSYGSLLKMLTGRSVKKGNLFKEIIHVHQIQDIVKEGYWSKLIYEAYDFDTGKLVFNSAGSDYTDKSIIEQYEKQKIGDKIVKAINLSNRKSILVAVPSVEEAKALSQKVVNSVAIWGDMPTEDRKKAIDGFKSLEIRVAIQVNVLALGFDHPQLDSIICGRPTASIAWWYQLIGRGVRIHPDKEDCLIIDFSGNMATFGRIECLYFIKHKSWELYGENGVKLTNILLHKIGEVTEEAERQKVVTEQHKKDGIITFGKFKGKKVVDTPEYWQRWMLENFRWDSSSNYIKKEIEKVLGKCTIQPSSIYRPIVTSGTIPNSKKTGVLNI